MSKITFTLKQQEELRKNIYVENVTAKGITYTDDFKHHCLSEYKNGKIPTQIFKDAGFDIGVVGAERASSSLKRWRKAYRKNGELGLRDQRKENSGRPSTKELTQAEIIEKQKAEIEYLRMELEFVKKLDMIERRALAQMKKNTKK